MKQRAGVISARRFVDTGIYNVCRFAPQSILGNSRQKVRLSIRKA